MAKIEYPLEQVLMVKVRRVEEQEKVVAEKQRALDAEEEKLKEREKDRDKAKDHYADKLQQLRDEMDRGTTSPKIQQMKDYLKVADEKVKIEERKVEEQKKQVEEAKQALDEAKEDLKKKRNEVEKLETHKKDWTKEMQKELQIIEEREHDEIGNVMYLAKKRQL